MKLKTRSIFQRYNITDEAVLLEGAERLGRASLDVGSSSYIPPREANSLQARQLVLLAASR